jgi:hypothetical protein
MLATPGSCDLLNQQILSALGGQKVSSAKGGAGKQLEVEIGYPQYQIYRIPNALTP